MEPEKKPANTETPVLTKDQHTKFGEILGDAYKYIQKNTSDPLEAKTKIRYATSHLLAFITYLGGNSADSEAIVAASYKRR